MTVPVKKSVLVTLADQCFIDQAKQLFAGAYLAGSWSGDYLILARDWPAADIKWFTKRGIMVKVCQPTNRPADLPGRQPTADWPAVVFDKLELFRIDMKNWDQVIFLDADIIVSGSLDQLVAKAATGGFWAVPDWWSDLAGKFVGRWENFLTGGGRAGQAQIKKLKQTYSLMGRAFNSGVMVFRTDQIRPDSFSTMTGLVNDYHLIVRGDELVFNLYFLHCWRSLPAAFNLRVADLIKYYHLSPNQITGSILHFVSRSEADKPWQPDNYFYHRWRSNLVAFDQIDFSRPPPIQSTVVTTINLSWFNHRLAYCRWLADYYIGLVGLLLKNLSPGLYWRLKKK